MNANTLFTLTGKTALVTGCDRGIGKAMATGLAEAGAAIIGVSRSMPLQQRNVEKEVQAAGGSFTTCQADLSNRNSLYHFI